MAERGRRAFLGLLGAAAALGRCEGLAAADDGLRVQRLSWAGLRLESPGLSLFVDPWQTAAVWDGTWTAPLVPIGADSPRRFALVTHLHNDHFDPAGVRAAVGENGVVVCHEEMAATVAARGFRVRPVKLWEPQPVDDASVIALPAVDGTNALQVSWLIAAGGRRVFHGGDTLWHGAWWQIAALGPLDAAFLPVNGARLLARRPPSEQPICLTPEQAVAAAAVLGARVLVPIHYGAHDPKAYVEEPDALARVEAEARRRGVSAQVVAPGDWVRWPARA